MDVDLERQFPFLVADVFDGLEARLMRRVVDEDVDPAELRYRFGNDRAAMIGLLYVAGGTSTAFRPAFVTSRSVSRASSCSSR
jgi:hypothetical protein